MLLFLPLLRRSCDQFFLFSFLCIFVCLLKGQGWICMKPEVTVGTTQSNTFFWSQNRNGIWILKSLEWFCAQIHIIKNINPGTQFMPAVWLTVEPVPAVHTFNQQGVVELSIAVRHQPYILSCYIHVLYLKPAHAVCANLSPNEQVPILKNTQVMKTSWKQPGSFHCSNLTFFSDKNRCKLITDEQLKTAAWSTTQNPPEVPLKTLKFSNTNS